MDDSPTKINNDEFVARPYQAEIMDIAIKQNTIIYLPTGSGKTYIAILLIKQFSEAIINKLHEGGKITVFLVNTVALVEQHCMTVKRHTDFDVGRFSGDMNVDFWNKKQWEDQLNQYQIIILTAQIFLDLLRHRHFTLDQVNLIIFDECHQGVDNHAMREIMKLFENVDKHDQPRVLGLTATLLNSNCKPSQVTDFVLMLEKTYHSKVATVSQLADILGFSTNPKEIIVHFSAQTPCFITEKVATMVVKLQDTLNNIKMAPMKEKARMQPLNPNNNEMKQLINMLENIVIHMEMVGIYGAWKSTLFYLIYMERLKRKTDLENELLVLSIISTQLTAIMKFLEYEMRGFDDTERIYRFSSPKTLKLLEILKNFKKPLCGIIFVQRRFTAKVLYYILKALSKSSEDFKHIVPDFLVGLNANPSEKENTEALFQTKMSKRVMRAFAEKDINLLVASNVVEEGVDIPHCTLVVKFDYPTNYRSYIQSKGRARHKDSDYVIFVPEVERNKFKTRYMGYQEVEKILEKYLVGKNEERVPPTISEITQDLYNDRELEPYYVNGPNSPHVSMTSAISLLNRYCQSLGRDKYCVPAPEWYIESTEGIVVIIFMPVMCPLRHPIYGPKMNNKISAKRAAALTVCIKLHKCGELTDNLLPQTEVVNIEEDHSHLFKHWIQEDFESGKPKAGTKKSVRPHNISTSILLYGNPLIPNVEVYLHYIEIEPLYDETTQKNVHVAMQFSLLTSNLSYAFLTTKPLPNLCSFPLYLSAGELRITINLNAKRVILTKPELEMLKMFNNFVFRDVLQILKEFLVFDDSADSGMILCVPVERQRATDEWNIAFDVIQNKTKLNEVTEPTALTKSNIVVTDDTYLGHIVFPWYRISDNVYIVTRVCHDLNAHSPFPSDNYESYVHYYNDKYIVRVVNPMQPLLLVKAIGKRLNCLKPRSITLHGGTKHNRQLMQDGFEEHLIPEMCILQQFPAELWYKAYILPSILHRMEYLLEAEYLRRQIAADTKVGVIRQEREWDPLPIDPTILKTEEKKPSPVPQRNVAEGEAIPLPPATTKPENNRPANKDYARKMLEQMYPWTDEEEPIDIERNIEMVRLMEITDYERFVSAKDAVKDDTKATFYDPNVSRVVDDYKNYVFKEINILNANSAVGPQLWKLYQVLMAHKANDIVNFERLETLGDSFLKLGVTLFLFLKYPNYNEGRLTNIKGKLIGNRHLYYVGKANGLSDKIKVSDFQPGTDWIPPGYHVPEVLQQKIANQELPVECLFNFDFNREEQTSGRLGSKSINMIEQEIKKMEGEEFTDDQCSSVIRFLKKQYIPDKTVSDCVEALIGAYLESNGIHGGLSILGWLQILPVSENLLGLFSEDPPSPFLFPQQSFNINDYLPGYKKVEEHLGYTFKNKAYLLQALTHASYTSTRVTDCYQRLEFLGDAVLDFLITCFIFENSTEMTPGQLTDLRSALVNNVTFAGLSVRNSFHKHMKYMNTKLVDVIDTFVRYQEERNFVINDEILILSEDDTEKLMAEHVHIPKALGDLFEAVAGAVFIDSGFDLQATWKVFHRIMYKEIEMFSANVPKNPVRMLYECTHAAPHFGVTTLIDRKITMIDLAVIVEGKKHVVHGFGDNKSQAKRAAAKLALRLLQKSEQKI